MTNHRYEAERLLNDADEWGQQAEEPSPEAGELICLAYSVAHALLAICDALTAADPAPTNPLTETHPWPMTGLTHTHGTLWGAGDGYALNEAKQREGQMEDAWQSRDWETVERLQAEEREEAEPDTPSGRAFTARDKGAMDAVRAKINALSEWLPAMEKALTPEPDPLDEDDHRDRADRDGDIWRWMHEGCWYEPGFPPVSHGPAECLQLVALPGPLAFAPEAPQEATGDDLSASEDEGEDRERSSDMAAMEAAFRKMIAIVEGWEGES